MADFNSIEELIQKLQKLEGFNCNALNFLGRAAKGSAIMHSRQCDSLLDEGGGAIRAFDFREALELLENNRFCQECSTYYLVQAEDWGGEAGTTIMHYHKTLSEFESLPFEVYEGSEFFDLHHNWTLSMAFRRQVGRLRELKGFEEILSAYQEHSLKLHQAVNQLANSAKGRRAVTIEASMRLQELLNEDFIAKTDEMKTHLLNLRRTQAEFLADMQHHVLFTNKAGISDNASAYSANIMLKPWVHSVDISALPLPVFNYLFKLEDPDDHEALYLDHEPTPEHLETVKVLYSDGMALEDAYNAARAL